MPKSVIRNYEAMVILNAQLSEDEQTAILDRLAKILTDGGATLKETAKWGRRRLAHAIGKKTDGFYVIFFFTLEKVGDTITNFERACRHDENVYRCLAITVPASKRGKEITAVVPSPGWISDFRFETTSQKRASMQNLAAIQRTPRERPDYRGGGARPDYRGDRGGDRPERSERHERSEEAPASVAAKEESSEASND